MKREGFIFERIACPANIRRAIHKAAIGKTDNRLVRNVLEHEDEAVVRVREILLSGFKPSPYKRSIIFDGANKKQREILEPRFYPDQIIHWALIMQIQSAIMRGMYDWSCCSIPGRGQSRCKQGVERWLKGDPENTKYCLKIDIRKFYPSVDNQILKAAFRRIIKDARTLSLIDAIIDSTKGLNIGNYTSQWFANFYLQPVDHFIKEKLRHTVRNGKRGSKPSDAIIYYARYNDDKNVAMSAINAAKKALGIRSPSRVMEEQVGLPTVQGIAQGVTKNSRILRDSITEATSGMKGAKINPVSMPVAATNQASQPVIVRAVLKLRETEFGELVTTLADSGQGFKSSNIVRREMGVQFA